MSDQVAATDDASVAVDVEYFGMDAANILKEKVELGLNVQVQRTP